MNGYPSTTGTFSLTPAASPTSTAAPTSTFNSSSHLHSHSQSSGSDYFPGSNTIVNEITSFEIKNAFFTSLNHEF
ncbi:11755_t:CDS:2 [Entrophospora sp. SA101]|nr:11755_t:CDS:2 [Entrophospora sp. SA101]CAJ0850387.1 17455_t:CDS:2 [Entrophospora sp. SA101]